MSHSGDVFARKLLDLALDPAQLRHESTFDPLRAFPAIRDIADNRRRDVEAPGNPRVKALVKSRPHPEHFGRIGVQNHNLETAAEYYLANQTVKKKISEIDTAEIPLRIKGLRKALGITQRQLAEGLSVSQGAVAQWEGGDAVPETKHLSRMAQLAGVDDDTKRWLLQAAGVTIPEPVDEGQMLRIPLYRDAVAAGSARVVDESDVADWLNVPKSLMPGGKIVALRVKGDSMYPLILTGHIVFVDLSDRDPHRLVEKMVAAREGNGVTIKWLRRDGPLFVLVPQRTARDNPVRVFKAGDDVGIVGRVVKWIGEPPK